MLRLHPLLSRGLCFLSGDLDVLDVVDRLRDQIADVLVMQRVDDALAVSPPPDEAKVAEQTQLMRNRRLLQLDLAGKLAHRAGRLAQPHKNSDPARRGERVHRLGNLAGKLRVHACQYQRLAVIEMAHA